jgi:hypothetical protein
MNPIKAYLSRIGIKTNPNQTVLPFAELTLWAGALKAEMKAYLLKNDVVELVTSVGGECPVIRRGSVGNMTLAGELWVERLKGMGFTQQLPTYNPDCWMA